MTPLSRKPADPGPCLPVRYVGDNAALSELEKELGDEPRYAVDTEFHRERTYFAQLALVQIAWRGGIALVDPLATDLALFAPVISGPGLVIAHAADQDLEVLERACGCRPKRLFDTQLAAGFVGMSTPSLQTLLEKVLGVRLEKGDQLTDWTRRPLTDGQLAYAAGDVAHLLALHDALVERLVERGRLGWVEEECAMLLERSRSPVVPEEAWWRLRHARQLHGRERGVAQAVAAWREQKAQSLDLPTRFVLSDLAVVSIAHRPPETRGELGDVRNIDGRHLAGGAAAELLEAIQRGRKLSVGEIRLPPGPRQEAASKPAVVLAAAFLSERARQLEIDPAILATRADLAAYLRDPPGGRLQTSWRHDLIGEPIRRLVSGEASLALERGSSLVLERRSYEKLTENEVSFDPDPGVDPPEA